MSELVRKAFLMAARAHHNQMYGDEPYLTHLYDVVSCLEKYYSPENCIAAGWLHDILEDTPTQYSTIAEKISPEVADIVYLVTDEKGKNRWERAERTYPAIWVSEEATRVKLADRISNVRQCLRTRNTSMLQMY